MRSRSLFGTSALVGAAIVSISTGAQAYDSLAVPCDKKPLYCQTGPLAFEQTDTLPIEWSFDTGWVPQGSPLEVRIQAGVWAHTTVRLGGELTTSWPNALELRTPGLADGGWFGFHYGASFSAEGKLEISVLGQDFSWQGDLPFVPQFDFQVQADDTFDSWGWKPGVTIQSTTEPQKIASIGLGDIIGVDIPGLDGGFELDIAFELKATYVTDRIVVSTIDGQPVTGGPIDPSHLETKTAYLGGPNVELDVHPEGTVDYDGVIHLIPAFYVDLLGQSWSIPIADIPIPFPITTIDWSFDDRRVHVPLPDLYVTKTEIDFGEVQVGKEGTSPLGFLNAGEALLHFQVESSDPDVFYTDHFDGDVDPIEQLDTKARFAPRKAGPFEAKLVLHSNDPSDPAQIVVVRGIGIDHEGGDGDDDPPKLREEGGCACTTPGGSSSGFAAPLLLALGALGMTRRRRRR
jgi:MYXO-CTERM domain-containing protein